MAINWTKFEEKRLNFQGVLRIFILILSLILIGSISYDTFEFNDPFYASPIYMEIQFWVCIFFLIDLSIEFFLTKHKGRYLFRYILLFLVCIPYLTVFSCFNCQIPSELSYVFRFIPLIRSVYALVIVVGWFTFSRTSTIFVTYLVILVTCVYLGSLVFYVCEVNINPLVKNFSDALWWATMEAVTVGSNIQAVTPIGKILSVFEAVFGMLMIPMFTVYVTNIVGTFQKVTTDVSGEAYVKQLESTPSQSDSNQKTDDKHKDDKADKDKANSDPTKDKKDTSGETSKN